MNLNPFPKQSPGSRHKAGGTWLLTQPAEPAAAALLGVGPPTLAPRRCWRALNEQIPGQVLVTAPRSYCSGPFDLTCNILSRSS